MNARFLTTPTEAEVYETLEFVLLCDPLPTENPYTATRLSGQFFSPDGDTLSIEGFCQSLTGERHTLRFLPQTAGRYTYALQYDSPHGSLTHTGSFLAKPSERRGIVGISPESPWHFVWRGTGEHYFWNGTTAYFLLGLSPEARDAGLTAMEAGSINRVRVALSGRVSDGTAWFEPVYPAEDFSFCLNPWVAERPEDVENPGFDVTRFHEPFWQNLEDCLRAAAKREIVVSVVFYVDGARPGADPFGKAGAGSEDEQRYYRYAAARLAAFPNLMWDVTNEYRLFRDDDWARQMGAFLKSCDPYGHLMSVHGHGTFNFRADAWADFALFQSWDEHGGNAYMLANRQAQQKIARPIPQINEEYGYEDHYPVGWGDDRRPPSRNADSRRRLAWEICMAGGYQTTGERANDGTGAPAPSGGGWINGRASGRSELWQAHAHLAAFFRSLRWWRMEPRNDLLRGGGFCLAEPGKQVAIYTGSDRPEAVFLAEGTYQAALFDPITGNEQALPDAAGGWWTLPETDGAETAFRLLRKDPAG